MMTRERILFEACPLCRGTDLADLLAADCSKHPLYRPPLSPEIRWKRCASCQHVFTEGYYSDEALALIFGDTNKSQQVGFDLEQQRHVSARMIDKVLAYASSGPWLDVGIGNGSLLFTAQEYGFFPIGIDLRRENAERMAGLGIQTYCEDFTRLRLGAPCSVISMADVLEHMPYPEAALRAAHALLGERGVLLVSMPNMDSVIWKAMDHNHANPYWGELEHYHNFTRDRLYRLLRGNGFEPVRYGVSERYRACMEVIALKAG